jgi:hypothetical protein
MRKLSYFDKKTRLFRWLREDWIALGFSEEEAYELAGDEFAGEKAKRSAWLAAEESKQIAEGLKIDPAVAEVIRGSYESVIDPYDTGLYDDEASGACHRSTLVRNPGGSWVGMEYLPEGTQAKLAHPPTLSRIDGEWHHWVGGKFVRMELLEDL